VTSDHEASSVTARPDRETPRRAVYTALFGGYEELQEQPSAAAAPVPFICFTDDAALTSDSWDVRVTTPLLPRDSVRSARVVKIRGHSDLDAFEETLWLDNRVTLTSSPDDLLNDFLADADVGLFEHSFRETVLDEFSAVADGGYDDPSRVYEQLIHYAETELEVLDEKPLWTGLIARRHTPRVQAAMATWADHVMRYSRRDQLSVSVALRAHHVRVARLTSDNRKSRWHSWPPVSPDLRRRSDAPGARFQDSIRAPLLALRELDSVAMTRAAELEAELADRDDLISDLRSERDQALAAADAASRRAEELDGAREAVQADLDAVDRGRLAALEELRQVRETLAARRRHARRLEDDVRRVNSELTRMHGELGMRPDQRMVHAAARFFGRRGRDPH
jgi:hypothetical protein